MKDEFLLTKTRDLLNQILSKWNQNSDIDADKFLAVRDGYELTIVDQDNHIWARRAEFDDAVTEIVNDFREIFEDFYKDQLGIDVVMDLSDDLVKLYVGLIDAKI